MKNHLLIKIFFLLISGIFFLSCNRDKKKELTAHLHFRNKFGYREDWTVFKEIEKYTGTKLKRVNNEGEGGSQELFEMIVISKKKPDIVGGDNLASNFEKYGKLGIFTPLNQLIEEHAPNIKRYLDENPDVKKNIQTEKGLIYHIPYIPAGKAAAGYWIRKDWLTKLNLNEPQNVEEFYNVLKEFRDKDPNGNGIRDEVPLFFRKWQEMLGLVTLWGARSQGTNGALSFYFKDGKYRHGSIEPEFREAIKNIAKWYHEKLIDPEVFSRGETARDTILLNDLGGVTRDWFASTGAYNDIVRKKNPEFLLKAMAPPENKFGLRIEETRRVNLKPDGWGITAESENKIEAIKYFDFFFSETGKRISNFGVEGVHYTFVNGEPRFKDEILNNSKPVNILLQESGAQIPIGFPQDYEYERQWTSTDALEGIDMYLKNGYLVEEDPKYSLSEEDIVAFNKIWPYLYQYIHQNIIRWILGEGDIDLEWDDYMKNLEELGMYKLLDMLNKNRK